MKLVVLRHEPSLFEAEIIKSLLEQAGIRSILQRDPLPGAGSFLQGAEVLVREEDVDRAQTVLNEASRD